MRYFEKDIQVSIKGMRPGEAKLIAYIPKLYKAEEVQRVRPAVLILPGGAYEHISERESEPVALKFASEGICAFVLQYSVAPAHFPQALCEALTAMSYIRENATEWYIDEDKIAVCGFSAGGHLAGCVASFWNKPFLDEYIKIDREKAKPNVLILCYPVITSGEFTHKRSMDYLLGDNKNIELLQLMALEKNVNSDIPPCFIWHTYEDNSVPVQNTLMYASALVEQGIPVESHIFRKGGHGLSIGNHLVNPNLKYGEKHMSSEWINEAIRFIFE